jgi:hypothetical protein
MRTCPHPQGSKKSKKSKAPAIPLYKPSLKPSDIGFRNELPLEYRGAEVISAEEVVYENGIIELQCIIDVGLGQEKILLVEKFSTHDSAKYATAYTAERFNVLPRSEYLSSIKVALQNLGLQVLENKYGAPTLNIGLAEQATDFFRIKSLVEDLLQNRGEVLLSAPHGRHVY